MTVGAQLGLGWTGRVMQLLNAACTLVLVNLLFAAGTLAGLGVLGVMPAGAAAASVLLRDGATLEREGGATRVFVRAYRRSFLRANAAGIPFLAAAALLAADALALPRLTGPASAVLTALTVAVALLTLLTAIVVVTLLERYDDPPAALLRYAVTVTLTSPATGAGVVVALAACGVIALAVPVFVPLAGASVPLAIAVRLTDRRLDRLDRLDRLAPAHQNH